MKTPTLTLAGTLSITALILAQSASGLTVEDGNVFLLEDDGGADPIALSNGNPISNASRLAEDTFRLTGLVSPELLIDLVPPDVEGQEASPWEEAPNQSVRSLGFEAEMQDIEIGGFDADGYGIRIPMQYKYNPEYAIRMSVPIYRTSVDGLVPNPADYLYTDVDGNTALLTREAREDFIANEEEDIDPDHPVIEDAMNGDISYLTAGVVIAVPYQLYTQETAGRNYRWTITPSIGTSYTWANDLDASVWNWQLGLVSSFMWRPVDWMLLNVGNGITYVRSVEGTGSDVGVAQNNQQQVMNGIKAVFPVGDYYGSVYAWDNRLLQTAWTKNYQIYGASFGGSREGMDWRLYVETEQGQDVYENKVGFALDWGF